MVSWKIDIYNNILIIDAERMDVGNDPNVSLLLEAYSFCTFYV